MKYILNKQKDNYSYSQYEVDFSVKFFEKLTDKDKEKIYKIIRIIDTFGDNKKEEISDKTYRFQTDQEGKDVLRGVVIDCRKLITKEKIYNIKDKKKKNMFEKLGLKK